MMLVYNDFSFLILEKLPALIINKNFFGVMTTLISLLYLLFSQEFLDFGIDKKGYISKAIALAIINTSLILSVFLIFGINFYQHRFWVYPFIFFNCTLTLYLLFRSLQKKYRPAWLYLIATFPVLLTGITETLSELHSVTIQEMHSWYYGCTFFEMYVLTLGIVYKFKIGQDEKKRIQAEVFANETIIKEKEGHRIAQDLHDKIGGHLGLLKLNITNFSKNSQLNKSDLSELYRSIEMIDFTAEEVRNIAHSLASSTLTKLGLVPLLMEIYRNSENPLIVIHNSDFTKRLKQQEEISLFAIIQECINNALKHSKASEISVTFNYREEEDTLTVMIEDDGVGFVLNKINLKKGNGLENINLRVKEHLSGKLTIETSPENGTVISIKFKV
jgi:signal transduction histidine kinase